MNCDVLPPKTVPELARTCMFSTVYRMQMSIYDACRFNNNFCKKRPKTTGIQLHWHLCVCMYITNYNWKSQKKHVWCGSREEKIEFRHTMQSMLYWNYNYTNRCVQTTNTFRHFFLFYICYICLSTRIKTIYTWNKFRLSAQWFSVFFSHRPQQLLTTTKNLMVLWICRFILLSKPIPTDWKVVAPKIRIWSTIQWKLKGKLKRFSINVCLFRRKMATAAVYN